ncbi:hypothetical protein E4U22_007414 [Claviceps purpurea]|nr:hypothetical protein E4U38_007131 [Claviceps purpurea]KAG6149184.1 hypothetical protein E4U37_006984 [Claviceps purpurea]KAG6247794.1 hypothetical protein E4U23_003495 [Claviceps purpurea]KAG6323011.1 hypothetical protein E4U22_007414 [Claviceps purpurea]
MPPRIPSQADLTPLLPFHTTIQPPSPPESTTTFLILLHGLGDSEVPFATFARNMALPGVMCISVRGPNLLPASLLLDTDTDAAGSDTHQKPGHYHWGDDIHLDSSTGEIDPDPGFTRAHGLVMDKLVKGVLVGECGWDVSDIMVLGFGQGGSLALGMGAALRGVGARDMFRGIVSIGGPLPMSMLSGGGRREEEKSQTHVLLCQVRGEEARVVEREFTHVGVVRWERQGVSMPRNREEMFPLMKFFAERLRSGGW